MAETVEQMREGVCHVLTEHDDHHALLLFIAKKLTS